MTVRGSALPAAIDELLDETTMAVIPTATDRDDVEDG